MVASSSHRSARRTASVTSLPLSGQYAGVTGGRDRVPGYVLGQVPVDRAALPGHQVGELAQRVRELLGIAERVRGSERAARYAGGWPPPAPLLSHRTTGTAGRLLATTGSSGLARPPLRVGRAEAERTISHLSVLSGRMEGS